MTMQDVFRPFDGARLGLRSQPHAPLAVLVVLAVTGVAFAGSSYWTSVATSTCATALVVAGTALLFGRLGLVSLCQFALAGISGWATLRIHHALHPPFEVSLVLGGLCASVIGVVWGLPALRIRGLYLALVTLMLAGAFQVVINVTGFPNGGPGLLGQVVDGPRVMMDRPAIARSDQAYLIYVAGLLLSGLLLIELHRVSKAGRAWALIRRSEQMAQASGVRVVFYKAWAFALSGWLAGIGGGAMACTFGQLDSSAFGASESILLFALTVVGGATSWLGVVVAAVLMRAVPALFNQVGVNGFVAMILFGVALVHALINAREGIAGQIIESLKSGKSAGNRAERQ
ncbi:MAG: branched-chain amino acid ABC transporter permease [Xanthobacteraceae bacterium]|nr:branched-chain amino acid ABC transporter permease [Xanthobacteraceae bacterium]